MTVLTGLCQCYAGGYDLSSNVSAIGRIGGGPNLLDVSPLNLVGFSRIAGRFDGEFGVNVLYDPTGAHIPLSALPTTLVPLMAPLPGTTAGDYVAMLVGKYVDYAPAIANDLAIGFALQAMASEGYPLEWGRMITAGKRTDTAATATGTGIALPTPPGVAATAVTGASAQNPTVVTSTAHGLQTGDSITIAGSNKSALNTDWTVTVTGNDTFTVPLDLTSGAATGGTCQRTSYRGWAAQNQTFSVVGTSMTVTIQDTEGASGTFANLTGGAFTTVAAAAVGGERLASTAGIIRKQVRVKTTGTFNPGVFATGIYVTPG